MDNATLDTDDYVPFAADGQSAADVLQGLISPAPAQSLVPPPPDTPPKTGPGETTPQTGSIATPPSQATPKVSGPPMLPGTATKPEDIPELGAYTPASVVAPRGTVQGDTAEYNRLQDTGSGISQIHRPWLKALATAGDIALNTVNPDVAAQVGGTQEHHNLLLQRAASRIGQDQSQQQAAATLQDAQSQIQARKAQAQQANARGNYYNPVPLSTAEAQAIGRPELVGTPMDARDYARMQSAYGRDQVNLQTHVGGQSRQLSLADATAIGMPSLSGAIMSNDDYGRALQQQQRNTQSNTNNQRTNTTRVRTTGMNNATSSANNQRNNRTRVTTTGMNNQTSTANNQRTNGARTQVQGMKDTNFGSGNTPMVSPKTQQRLSVGESVMVDGRRATVVGVNPQTGKVRVSY